MVENSGCRFSIILFFSFLFTQEFIWENAEDFLQYFFDPEIGESYQNNYSHRLRYSPEGKNENWRQKITWGNSRIKLGWRIDKPALTDSVQNRKGFISANYKDYQIIIGNTQIQMGNSLLFGSDYNSIKSPGSLSFKTY